MGAAMSNERSGSKWIVGCLVAGVLMLLVCGGGFALVGWYGHHTARQISQSVSLGIEEQAEQTQFASDWQAPQPGAGPDVLFPENVNAWRLASHDDDAAIVELAIERDGRHARYESGVTGIDVYVYEVPADKQTRMFLEAAAEARLRGRIDDGTSHRLVYEISPRQTYGHWWWCRGWLFVLISDINTLELDAFQTQYLSAVAGRAAEAAAADGIEEPAIPVDDTAPEAVLDPGGETAPEDPAALGAPD
jgi:hypothetical protein